MNSTFSDNGITLSHTQFDRVFPFHLVLDDNLLIVEAGRSLLLVCPDVVVGHCIAERFSLLNPVQQMNYHALADAESSPTLWRHNASGLRFRGQLLLVGEPKSLVLLWSPWLEDEADIARYGFKPDDFALHDPTLDLLQILKNAVQDERDLADKFSTERCELLRENHELSRQFGLLWDELAMLKQEEADIYKLSLIASQAESAMIITDAECRVEWVNDGFTHITGYTQEDMLGKTPGSVLQGKKSDPATIGYIRGQIAKGESFSVEIINYKKSGQTYWVQIEAQPIRDEDNRIANWTAIERDISLQKSAELSLMEAKKTAEAANRAKSEFLANMSHEIRTPMHGVQGMLDLLRQSPLTHEQQEFADTAAHSVENLLTIINDILDFSKIEAGKLELDHVDFDLRDVIEKVCVLLAVSAYRKGLELNCFVEPGLPSRLQGDPMRLRQIMTNLIGNAIKFTAKGEISIEVLCISQNDERVTACFTVRDTGIGILAKDQQRLFNPFEQADGATTRRFGGTGLGLAISKSLVNLMGGEIYVESEPGEGSSFWFTAEFSRQPHIDVPLLPKSLAKRRVLVVDDNATNRAILGHFLKDWGAEATLVDGAAQALTVLREADSLGRPFEVALLDLQMPDMDGLMLSRAMASDEALRATPRILLSSGGSVSETERIEAGIHQMMTKPLRHHQLFEAIVSSLSNHQPKPRPVEVKTVDKPAQFPGRRVLLVEDNPINQKVALKMLGQHQVTTVLADDGRKALTELEQHRFDLVLMDCHMPEMDGYEATLALRDLEQARNLPRTPVVALTADTIGEAREKCLASGMDDFLAKPFLLGELTGVLSRWLSP